MTLPRPIITEPDVHAIRKLIAGTADAGEQVRGMRWIAEQACRIFDSPYVAEGNDRETFIAIGRHQVGVLISAMQTPGVLEAARASDLAKLHPAAPKPRRGKPNA